MIGVERERYIVDPATCEILPLINKVLPRVHAHARKQQVDVRRFTYELFAGQVEDKTPPCCSLVAVREALEVNDAILERAARELGLVYDHGEYVEPHRYGAIEVNPFDQRHSQIWERLDQATRLAASSVAAVHVHISVDEAQAVDILNRCRGEVIEQLVRLGDHSQGRRIASYRQMAQMEGTPPYFASFRAVMAHIREAGGEKNVWDLVRYKPSTQTIEFRMFGATPDMTEVIGYIEACLEIVE